MRLSKSFSSFWHWPPSASASLATAGTSSVRRQIAVGCLGPPCRRRRWVSRPSAAKSAAIRPTTARPSRRRSTPAQRRQWPCCRRLPPTPEAGGGRPWRAQGHACSVACVQWRVFRKPCVESLWPSERAHRTALVDQRSSRDGMRRLDEAGAEVPPRVVGASSGDPIRVSMRMQCGAVGHSLSFDQRREQEFVQRGVRMSGVLAKCAKHQQVLGGICIVLVCVAMACDHDAMRDR